MTQEEKPKRNLNQMTNIERQEYGLILCGELDDNPYDWLVRHNFLVESETNIGIIETTKGPNPPIYLSPNKIKDFYEKN